MKFKVVSDSHSNFHSLKESVESSDDEDVRVYCGDIVGLMGFPSETVDYIREKFDFVVKGNHDVAVVEKQEGHVNNKKLSEFEENYVNRNLSKSQKQWIKNLNSYQEFEVNGFSCLIAHAKPYKESSSGIRKLSPSEKSKRMGSPLSHFRGRNNINFDYTSTKGIMPKDFVEVLTDLKEKFDYIFLGHTHKQHYVNGSKFGHNCLLLNRFVKWYDLVLF